MVCTSPTWSANLTALDDCGKVSALQSAWLNEAATLFRRKYYKNGSHAGFASTRAIQITSNDLQTA